MVNSGMVGKRKQFKKTCPSVLIEAYVPKNNFYRHIKQLLRLDFLYQVVAPYYGKCGQKSIDPVVFFKLQLVAHFENICSERALIEKSQLRLDILYFLDYSLGESLPCHSTLSRTRKRLPAAVFETCFQAILSQCVEAGMVSGHTQAVDAAFVEANASLDTFKRKAILAWQLLKGEAKAINDADIAKLHSPFTALAKTTKPIRKGRNNATHQSLTDTDARINHKPGKPCRLYYLSTIAVDSYRPVITHIQADLADERDSKHLVPIVDKVSSKLKQCGLPLQYLLADGGFSSGENGPATCLSIGSVTHLRLAILKPIFLYMVVITL